MHHIYYNIDNLNTWCNSEGSITVEDNVININTPTTTSRSYGYFVIKDIKYSDNMILKLNIEGNGKLYVLIEYLGETTATVKQTEYKELLEIDNKRILNLKHSLMNDGNYRIIIGGVGEILNCKITNLELICDGDYTTSNKNAPTSVTKLQCMIQSDSTGNFIFRDDISTDAASVSILDTNTLRVTFTKSISKRGQVFLSSEYDGASVNYIVKSKNVDLKKVDLRFYNFNGELQAISTIPAWVYVGICLQC